MKNFLAVLFLSSLAFGQGVVIAPQTALKTINGLTQPLAGATITVCPSNSSGIPCAPATVSVFQDVGLTIARSNPFTADSSGNYQFAVAPGQYTVTITGSGFTGYSYQISANSGTYSNAVTGVFTNTQANEYLVSQIGSLSPGAFFHSGYNGFGGQGGFSTDAIASIVVAPVGATAHQFNGVNASCITNAVSSPLGALENCVALFGTSQAAVSNSASWGGNVVSYDTPATTGSLVIGFEPDLGLFGAPTRFQGVFVTGAALVGTMPAGPVMGTINIASNSAAAYGVSFPSSSTAQFPVAYWSARGSAAIGAEFDASCYAGACNSQSILLGSNNGSTAFTFTFQEDQLGDLLLSSTGTGVGVRYPSYSFAQLNVSAPPGTLLFCTDCKNVPDGRTAGQVCVNSGTGAFAKRENGAWDCN